MTETDLGQLLQKRKSIIESKKKIDLEIKKLITSKKTRFTTIKQKKLYQILKSRFIEFKTLEETGKDLGVQRERVRQLEPVAFLILQRFLEE